MNTISEPKPRIEFIDLAKGLCIFLVVMKHCGALPETAILSMLRMPLYFLLSGLFFKTYGGVKNLILKKTNKLVIPMVTFYLLGELAFLALNYWKPDLLHIQNRHAFIDLFTDRHMFNLPVWFLLGLFWCNVLFVLISTAIKNDYLRIILITIIGAIGYTLGQYRIILPLFIDTAMTALPFFCIGYYLKKTPILYPNRFDRYNWLFCLVCGLIVACNTFVPSCGQNSYYANKLSGGVWAYIFSLAAVMCALFLCKMIKHLPLISYVGRYSIIILVLHYILKRPAEFITVSIFGDDFSYRGLLIFAITMVINIVCIPLCLRFIPYLVAQKDLIRTKN